MAVDILCWAPSLAPWPLRTIQAPTPVTRGVNGGFGCQNLKRYDCCLGTLTLRAVQAAVTALLWLQIRTGSPFWVSLFTSALPGWCLIIQRCGHYRRALMSPVSVTLLKYLPCHYWCSPRHDCWKHTGLSTGDKPSFTDTYMFSNCVSRAENSDTLQNEVGGFREAAFYVYHQIPQNLICRDFYLVFFAV